MIRLDIVTFGQSQARYGHLSKVTSNKQGAEYHQSPAAHYTIHQGTVGVYNAGNGVSTARLGRITASETEEGQSDGRENNTPGTMETQQAGTRELQSGRGARQKSAVKPEYFHV